MKKLYLTYIELKDVIFCPIRAERNTDDEDARLIVDWIQLQ